MITMIEESLESFTDEIDTLNIENNPITINGYDFNKYNLYVEKIRALFVPSLEPRIHSCLAKFVYRKNEGQSTELPYLKRCLDVAAAWREPVDAFCMKWADEKFFENMLSHALKYLIKDGLVDCFLNSIILNNRINKVCRDLDALGVEKDLLRYLTVWNYFNERDYWIENDEEMEMSLSRQFYDSIDRHSDLDVEIGSKIDNYEKVGRRALKRRATDDSSEDLTNDNNNNFGSNIDVNDSSKIQYESWLSLDSSIKEESRSSDGTKRKRAFCQKFPCRSSNCPIYRLKNSQQADWDGKILKLQISKSCSASLKCETLKFLEKSKLHLPCKFDDLIGKIIKADVTLFESSSLIPRRKKFQASIINICCRINEILRKIGKNEIRRCRLDCEIFRNFLSFRLMERESNGCKVCLLSERVVINKIDCNSRNASKGSSVSQLTQIAENENSQESDITIYESARFDLEEPQINQSTELKSSKIKKNSEGNLKPAKLNNSKESTSKYTNENGVENQECRCDISFDPGRANFDQENQENHEPDHLEYFEINSNNFKEFGKKESSIRLTGNILEDQVCKCNTSFDAEPDHESKNGKGIDSVQELSKNELFSPLIGDLPDDQACRCNTSLDDAPDHFSKDQVDQENSQIEFPDPCRKNQGQLTRKKTFTNLIGNMCDDQASLCNTSFVDTPDQFDNKIERNPKELTRKESSIHSNVNISKDQACHCDVSFENPPDNIDHENKNEGDCKESLEKRVEDIPQSNRHNLQDAILTSNSHEISERRDQEIPDPILDCIPANTFLELQKDMCTSKSVTMIASNRNDQENQHNDIACACPSDCTCTNKEIFNDQAADCDSQCSCDSCDDLDQSKSLNLLINDSRIADISNKIQTKKSQDLITSRDEKKSNGIEVQEIKTDKVDKAQIKSTIPKEFNPPRKSSSRSLNETRIKDSVSHDFDQEILRASNLQYNCSEIKKSKDKSSLEGSPIVSGRFKKSKGQRINISIELCPESESSNEKISRSESSNILTLQNDSNKIKNSKMIAQKNLPSRQSRCNSIDRKNSEKQLILMHQKNNTKDECLDGTNDKMHSPPRPLEFRDYLPPSLERPSTMRNPNVYGFPMKSDLRSNHKFDRRSTCQDQRNVKNYDTREYWKSMKNHGSYDKKIEEHIRSDQEVVIEELPRVSRKSDKFSNSIINGPLCHAFSSSSVNRMRHLIKTKLRRILLERDKSTNTSKTTLTNRKYRVSVPNGKTERSSFGRQSCRTIWESQSASDSTRASQSFISDDRTFSAEICDREKITNLFYSSSNTRPKISLSNCPNFSRISCDSDYLKNRKKIDERNETNGVKNCPRLSGGSDFISCKKNINDEEFRCLKKQRHELSSEFAKKENKYSLNSQIDKSFGKSINCSFHHEIMQNTRFSSANNSVLSKSDDSDSRVLRKKYENELIECSGKLDLGINSTSRHIYLYEFGNFETSNDELFRYQDKKEPIEKFNCTKIHKEKMMKKNLKINKKVYSKNIYDSRMKKSRFSEKENKNPRNNDEIKNSSSNTDTINYRQRGLSHLDYDLRSKLSQYVSLCKNVKYSLLKRLRKGEIYEVAENVPCCDRYKFGDS